MSKARILIVEDESIIAMHLRMTLLRLGYATLRAGSGEEALKVAAEHHPDLAIMDIMLGDGMDGIETAERLWAEASTRVVYLTAYSSGAILERAKHTEPMGYMVKPFREEELRSTVEVALFRCAAERRWRTQQSRLVSAIVETMGDGAIVTDQGGRVTAANQAAQGLLGLAGSAAQGRELVSLFTAEAGLMLSEALSKALREGVVARFGPVQTGNGREIRSGAIVPQQDGTGGVTGALVLCRSPEQPPAAAHAQTRDATPAARETTAPAPPPPLRCAAMPASVDPLTGLPPRPDAEKAIAEVLARGERRVAAVFVLNHLGRIAERFGQSVVDELILLYSIHLAQWVALSGALYRWSGPAFLVLMEPGATPLEVARELASFASLRLEKTLHLSSRTALVVLSGAYQVLCIAAPSSAQGVVEQIDGFAAMHDGRQRSTAALNLADVEPPGHDLPSGTTRIQVH